MSAPTTYAYFLEVPQKISASGVTFFRDILVRFKASLEEFSGRAISEEALADAIAVYNENRRLLHRAYDLRREGRLSGVECHQMVLAGMLMPKEEHNRLMADALNDVEKREPINDRVKLLVSASMLDRPDFLKLIEDCGGAIVADDMPVGSRYFFYPVGHASDALGSLAERYLAHIPCPRKMLPQDRFDYITEIIQGADVQGAVIHNLKACDCHLYEYPYLKKMLEDMGMPVLFFRGEETETEQETQRDDIEAFVEMIRG